MSKLPYIGTFPAALILTCVKESNFDDEVVDYDDCLRLNISDFPIVPPGTKLQIYDGHDCLFADGEVKTYGVNNSFSRLEVTVMISQVAWENVWRKCDKFVEYNISLYPRELTIFDN